VGVIPGGAAQDRPALGAAACKARPAQRHRSQPLAQGKALTAAAPPAALVRIMQRASHTRSLGMPITLSPHACPLICIHSGPPASSLPCAPTCTPAPGPARPTQCLPPFLCVPSPCSCPISLLHCRAACPCTDPLRQPSNGHGQQALPERGAAPLPGACARPALQDGDQGQHIRPLRRQV